MSQKLTFKSALKIVSASVILLGLAACARSNPLEVTISHCPAVAVVGDVGTLTRLQGETQNADDLRYTATINQIERTCLETEENVSTTVSFSVAAVAGPAYTGNREEVEYFVAVLRDNSEIVTKKYYTASLQFNSSGRAVSDQKISLFLPELERARRYDYELLVGFKMTPSEIAFNMEQER